MNLQVEAKYQGGIFRPATPIVLDENEVVLLTIARKQTRLSDLAGLVKWTGDPEVLRKIAEDPEFDILESP